VSLQLRSEARASKARVRASRYHVRMDWKDWCKLIGAVVFLSIGVWRFVIWYRNRNRHSH
jgi:hypothetical protein